MVFSLFILRRFIPLFVSFLIFIFIFSAIFLFSFRGGFFLLLSLALIFSLLLTLFLIQENLKNLWFLLVILFLLEVSAILFLIFIQHQTFKIIFILLLTFFIWLFLEAIFRFLYRPRLYAPYSLENISFLLLFFIIFWSYASLFALKTFFHLFLPLLLFLVCLVNFVVIYLFFRSAKVSLEKKIFIYYFFPTFVILELFYTFLFLPTAFYVNGLILAILFFLMMNLLKEHLAAILTNQMIKKNLVFALSLLILTIFLTKWR